MHEVHTHHRIAIAGPYPVCWIGGIPQLVIGQGIAAVEAAHAWVRLRFAQPDAIRLPDAAATGAGFTAAPTGQKQEH